MGDDLNRYIARVQDCEAAIRRIRTAIQAGNAHGDAVGDDFMAIWNAVAPRLARYARRVHYLGPEVEDEVMDAMRDQLQKNIWSLEFVSLETSFGAYLKHMPLRVIQTIQRKHGATNVSSIMERLDAVNEEGLALHETVADVQAEAAFTAVERREDLHAAIARLPDPERHVMDMRLANYENNAVAQHLGISPASATRIYQRGLVQLRQWLTDNEE